MESGARRPGPRGGDGGTGIPMVSWEESRVSEVGSPKGGGIGEGQRGVSVGVGAGPGAPSLPLERKPPAACPLPPVIIAVVRFHVPATCWGPAFSATDSPLSQLASRGRHTICPQAFVAGGGRQGPEPGIGRPGFGLTHT